MIFFSLVGCMEKQKQAEPMPTEAATKSPSPVPTKQPEPQLLARAETEILDGEENRLHNISLAIESINGYVLEPGESFSFNEIVGKRTEERGYRMASVIIQKEKKRDFGGGVCQVSSTLFQAARAAGFSILERHSHQKDVGYAHQGDDAAVDYGTKDLRFANSSDAVVKISMSLSNDFVSAELYALP